MPALKNPRHETFAYEIAKGSSAVGAYRNAGFKSTRGTRQNARLVPRARRHRGARLGFISNKSETKVEVGFTFSPGEALAKLEAPKLVDVTPVEPARLAVGQSAD